MYWPEPMVVEDEKFEYARILVKIVSLDWS